MSHKQPSANISDGIFRHARSCLWFISCSRKKKKIFAHVSKVPAIFRNTEETTTKTTSEKIKDNISIREDHLFPHQTGLNSDQTAAAKFI